MDDFEQRVVGPYVAGHATGETPNPCIECNRHVKFARFLRRAVQLGFDGIATGHHARVDALGGRHRLRRGADAAKDQSYVLYVLGQDELARCQFPVGALTKAEVRRRATALGLRTADKPDSQEVCFVTAGGGREALLRERISLRAGRVVDSAGALMSEPKRRSNVRFTHSSAARPSGLRAAGRTSAATAATGGRSGPETACSGTWSRR